MYNDPWIQALVDAYNEKNGIAPEAHVGAQPLPHFDQGSMILPPSFEPDADAEYFSAILNQQHEPCAQAIGTEKPKSSSIAPMAMSIDDAPVASPLPIRRRAFHALGAAAFALVLFLSVLAGRSNRLQQEARPAISESSVFGHLGAKVRTSDGVTPEQLPIASIDLSPVLIGLYENPEELTKDDITFEESIEIVYDIAPANGPEAVTARAEEPAED